MLAGVSWENEVIGDVVQHWEGFTALQPRLGFLVPTD